MSVTWAALSKCNILNSLHYKSIYCRYRQRLRLFSAVRFPSKDMVDVYELKGEVIGKIIYNELLYRERKLRRKEMIFEKKAFMKICKKTSELPKSRSLISNYLNETNEKSDDMENDESFSTVNFPYEPTKVEVDNVNDNEVPGTESSPGSKYSSKEVEVLKPTKKKFEYENPSKYLGNDESVAEIEPTIEPENFGTCDPNIPCSKVPCSGCGALLHCMSLSIPGFMPKETFINLNNVELEKLRCQRCLFLEEYNVALDINVNPDDYLKIISQINFKYVNIVLMVDLTDFPCSISEDILKIIGKVKQVFVVGNKVDLLLDDGEFSLRHKKRCLTNYLQDSGLNMKNVKYIGLISAKTGYGIEQLISAIHIYREDRGHFYILGCTNSGKSSLFNRLIQSDMCKVKADLLQRATVSQWPGTTLNLLKFPVSRRQDWHSVLRMHRLKVAKQQETAVAEIRRELMKNGKNCQFNLIGYIGKTVSLNHSSLTGKTDDEEKEKFKYATWFYDTPGVVHRAQILNLLTTHELTKVLPSKIILPRNFRLHVGNTLFIGGLARIDYLSGPEAVWFTVFASESLPVTITKTDDADSIYKELLGTKWFVVPCGNKERMEKWPALMSKVLEVYGQLKNGKGSDVVLSSAGWVTVSPPIYSSCLIRAWTPDGRGLYLRQPTLIRDSHTYRGKKIGNTPAYAVNMKCYESINVIDENQNVGRIF